jgi:hypothetical protein
MMVYGPQLSREPGIAEVRLLLLSGRLNVLAHLDKLAVRVSVLSESCHSCLDSSPGLGDSLDGVVVRPSATGRRRFSETRH